MLITAWALIHAAERGDAVICAREENTHSFSDGIQLRSAALSQPIWLHLESSWGRAHTNVRLGCLRFYWSAPDLRPSKLRIIGQRRTPLARGQTFGDRNARKRAKKKPPRGMHDVLPGEGAPRPQLPLVYFYSRRLSGQLRAAVPSTRVHGSRGRLMNTWMKNIFASSERAQELQRMSHKCRFLDT